MIRQILALGAGGARLLQAFVFQCMTGLPGFGAARLMLMGAPSSDGERLRELVGRYTRVHRRLGTGSGPFAPDLELVVWPEETARLSLGEQASADTDRLLCRALFTPEQAALSPAHALDQSGSVAAMTWASCLESTGDPALAELIRQVKEEQAPCLLLVSLSDPSGASGVTLLSGWLQKHCGTKPSAVLLLPVHRDDDADISRDTLLSGRLPALLEDAALIGMPEDCRRSREGACLADWCAALAAVRLLAGRRGVYTWRVPAGNLSWQAFGDMEEDVREGFSRLLRMGVLMGSTYGTYLENALSQPSWIRDRMTGWYHTHFSDVRHLTDEERAPLPEAVKALRLCVADCAAWLVQVLDNLPPVLQWADALQAAAAEAQKQYEPVLETAGQLAWMLDEAEQSGMAEETFVHRYDMEDSEAEAAMKLIEELRDKLSGQLAEQEAYFRALGGRVTRALLQQLLRREEESAQELRSQAEETARRIAKAALVATPEDEPKIAQARARLTRMERQVTLRAGRATRVRRDLASWSRDDRRALMPTLDISEEENAVLLFPMEWLAAFVALRDPEARESRVPLQQLTSLWPWEDITLKVINERVAAAPPDVGADCLGGFIRVLWQACGTCDRQ